MTIWVDGDACPVKAEVEEIATRHRHPVKIVCNGGLRPSANPLIEVVYVSEGLDVADRHISDNAGPGDVVITADIPLAADCVDAGALVLKPDGEALTERNIAQVLSTRNLMTEMRSANPLSQGGGGKTFSKADRSRFRQALEQALRKIG
jgi:hypothetical protein